MVDKNKTNEFMSINKLSFEIFMLISNSMHSIVDKFLVFVSSQ